MPNCDVEKVVCVKKKRHNAQLWRFEFEKKSKILLPSFVPRRAIAG